MKKRNGNNEPSESTQTVSSVQMLNAMHAPMITRRRPILSASGAMRMAPSITPKRPALNVGPSAPRGRLQAWLIAGAT